VGRRSHDRSGALGGQGSAAADINNLGAVAGEVNTHDGAAAAAVWAHGQWTTLVSSLNAYAINDRGQVLGDDGINFPFLWTAGQATSVFAICPGLVSAQSSFFGADLNDLSWILGTETEPGPVYDVPVVCRPDGTVTQLPQLAGSTGDYAAAINNLGVVAGTAALPAGSGVGDVVLSRPSLSG